MAEPSVNSEPGNCHELIKSDDRGLLESGLAKLQMVGRDQEVGRGQRFAGDGRRDICHDEIWPGGLGGKNDRWAVFRSCQVSKRKWDQDHIPSSERTGQTGSPSSRE